VAAPWWLPLLSFALFVGGFVGGDLFVQRIGSADRFDAVQQFDLWGVLIGGLIGLGLASMPSYLLWLLGVVRLHHGAWPGTVLTWAAVTLLVLLTPLLVLFVGTDASTPSLDRAVARETRPLTLVAGASQLLGLLVFVGLRQAATTDALWAEPAGCRLRLVLRLRAELRRVLVLPGAFLTLLVVTVGMRRQAFVALDPAKALAPEGVLLYGLVFAVLLGGFYLTAASAIDRRASLLLDELAPLPDPEAADFLDLVARRDTVAGMLGSGGSWQSFQTTVVIAAPLLTALLGSALGG
jgi:hypothetical protein